MQQQTEAGIDTESIAARVREVAKGLPRQHAKTRLRAG
jgi:hypothetical protein